MVEEEVLEKGFTIEDNDFRMEFDGRVGFDLYLKNSKDKFVLYGYNIPFKNCLKRIQYYRINKKLDKTSIGEFLKEYEKIENIVKNLIEPLNV